jgi:transcription elongation factor GreA
VKTKVRIIYYKVRINIFQKKNRKKYHFQKKSLYLQKYYVKSSAIKCRILFVLINFSIMVKTQYITEEGLQKLREELEHLRGVERPEISRQIAEARDKGDLSENAEYDAAKEAQGMLEMRISELESKIANARVIDKSKIDSSKVQILSKVKLKNLGTNAVMEYTLVAEAEANLRENKLSVGTPIAKALMGHKKGEIVEVKIPAGVMRLEIVNISI